MMNEADATPLGSPPSVAEARWVPSEEEAARYRLLNRRRAPLQWKQTALRLVEGSILLALDAAMIAAATAAALAIRFSVLPLLHPAFSETVPMRSLGEMTAVAAAIVLFLGWGELYGRRLVFWDEARRIAAHTTLAMVAIFAGLTLTKVADQFSRPVLVLLWLLAMIFLIAGRYAGKRLLYRLALFRRMILILGARETGLSTFDALRREPTLGNRVAGFLDEAPDLQGRTLPDAGGAPVLGTLSDLDRVIESHGIQELIIAIPSMPGRRLSDLVNRYYTRLEAVHVIPDLMYLPVFRTQPEYLLHDQALMLRIPRPTGTWAERAAKRAFDLAGAAALLLLMAVPLTLIALLIRLTSAGPAILVQRRLAHRRGTFPLLKFRSMYLDQEERLRHYLEQHPERRAEWEQFKKLRGFDPRVTTLGKMLRRWSLDEFPQLLNVLAGHMSLVGPRPYLPRELDHIGSCAPVILSVRPGLTGLWQVRGRSRLTFDDRLRLDLSYVRNRDLWLDAAILLRTVFVLLRPQGQAY